MSETKTGTVYKISTPKTDKVYIGSTTQDIKIRFCNHKAGYKAGRSCASVELMELGECKIEALEVLYNCTKRELEIKEQFYLELLKEKTVNKKNAYTSNDQRKKDKAENYKRWRDNNPERYKFHSKARSTKKCEKECLAKNMEESL